MPDLVRFGPFELDLEAAELRTNGRSLRLPEQQFQILHMLLLAEGGVVSREEIRKRLWPNDTVVEFDRSINAAIMKLRLALGDTGDKPRFIETLVRRGYRLMVPVEREQSTSPRAVRSRDQAEFPGWPESLSLPCAGNPGRRRHGPGLQGRGPEAQSPCGTEVPARRNGHGPV